MTIGGKAMSKSAKQVARDLAYQAGQAAKRDHLSEDVCPFGEGPEREAWLAGRRAKELGEQWIAGGTALRHAVQEGGR